MAEFLYIHIPFCIKKCNYCDFLSLPYDEDLVQRYTHALCRELQMKKTFAPSLKSVYLGGGTPSILPETCLEQIFSVIRKQYTISPEAEITVEANPGTITGEKADVLISLGVNRISLGVQSFSDDELKILERVHTAGEAVRSAEILRRAGVKNLSLDLMYGIPGQTFETWENSLHTAKGLFPQHISAYELTLEKGTRLTRLIDADILVLPDDERILHMSSLAIDTLAEAGFEHYEISNYALPGHRCIHNVNYWDSGEYIAAGAGAHAFLNGCRAKNTDSLTNYITKLDNLVIPETESVRLSDADRIREFIMLGLRQRKGIHLDDADDLNLDIATAARQLVEDDFTEIIDNRLLLTRKGLAVANIVIIRLLQNLEA
jgi:oxygen-independent coproporphyrinogen-3 oxidase